MPSKKRVLVMIADGTEEMEAVITIDLLRRAHIEVVVAGLKNGGEVICSRGVRLHPDAALSDVEGPFDAIVLPGGMGGARAFAADEEVGRWLRESEQSGRLVAAICAAPIAFVEHGVFAGRTMTSHPAVEGPVSQHAQRVDQAVVADGQLVTSQGPGTAVLFGLALIDKLMGPDAAADVRKPLMMP